MQLKSEEFPYDPASTCSVSDGDFLSEIEQFCAFGTRTRAAVGSSASIPVLKNEFWTSRQRAAGSLHEVSYRACFKPQLPRFFIERLTRPGDLVYDPFMGRGTTLLEAIFLGRRAAGCDVSPLSAILLTPRLAPPSLEQIQRRLNEINLEVRGNIAGRPARFLPLRNPTANLRSS